LTQFLQRPIFYDGAKAVAEAGKKDVYVVLNVLEGFLNKTKFFAGEELTLADLSILPVITSLNVSQLISFNLNCLSFSIQEFGASFADTPKLAAWFEFMKSVPGFEENREGASRLAVALKQMVGVEGALL